VEFVNFSLMRRYFSFLLLVTTGLALSMVHAVAAPAAPINTSDLADCSQEMTTCPCAGIPVKKDLVRSGDVLMIRMKETPVVSFPFLVQ